MEENQILSNEQLQSKVISFLRFPLIVGVILIHTQINEIDGVYGDMGAPYLFNGAYPLYESILYLFAQILARIAVPLFFLFSGFLFFYRTEEFTKKVYFTKIKKRIRTLFIPYLFWNIFFILVYNVSGILFSGAVKHFIGEGFSIQDWLMLFWDYDASGYPISYQFWFIRDLMVVVLFTPIIYWLTKKLNYYFPLLLGVLWFMRWWFNVSGFSIDAFFFFALGAYFSIKKKNFVELLKPYMVLWGISYVVFVAITFCFRDYDWIAYTKRASIVLGIAFVIALSALCIKTNKWKLNEFLSESSFFIYAYHVIALPIIIRVLWLFIPVESDLYVTILYFVWAALAIVIGLVAYYILKRWFPTMTAFITGGR